MHDINGRVYAKVSEVKVGDILIADDAFSCLKEGDEVAVAETEAHELYVPCLNTIHLLKGQIEKHKKGGYYIGFYLKVDPTQ